MAKPHVAEHSQRNRREQLRDEPAAGELEHVHVQQEGRQRVAVHIPLLHGLADLGHVLVEDGFQLSGAARHQLAQHDAKQREAHDVDIRDVLGARRCHDGAAARQELYQPLALENAQRLADRGAADAQHVADVLFQQALARVDQVHGDHAGEPHGDLFGHRCRRARQLVAIEDGALHRHHDGRAGCEKVAQVGGVDRFCSGHMVLHSCVTLPRWTA